MAAEDGSLWQSVKNTWGSFDAWSAEVFHQIGQLVAHPVDTTVGAVGTVAKPIGDFFSSTLWKVIILLALVVAVYLIFKDEIQGAVKHG